MTKLSTTRRKLDPALARYPEPMAGLLSLGETDDDFVFDAWSERLKDHAPDLIRIVLDDDLAQRDADDPAVWAPIHALHILSVLGPREAAEPLLACMNWDSDWFEEDLPPVYAAIGIEAIPLLRAYIEEPANDEMGRSRAARSLSAVAQAHPEASDEVVDLLTALLDRPGADTGPDEEMLTASVINELADLEATSAYEAIRRAYDEDRVDATLIDLEDVERIFGMLPDQDFEKPGQTGSERGVRLTLKCTACDREREHVFPKVYYHLGTARDDAKAARYDPLIIPQRVVCPKCGAVDEYELGGMGHLAITASLLARMHPGSAGELDPSQQVQFITFTTRWGPMHPREAVERYHRELAKSPDNVALHIGLGNVLRLLGRYGEADTEYQRALQLDPTEPEIWTNLAQMAGLQGDITGAIRCWTKVQELVDHRPGPEDSAQQLLSEAASEALAELLAGRIPESEPSFDIPLPPLQPANRALSPALSTQPSRHPKVGRNDPCWCGSGKKYKRCHLVADQRQAGAGD